MSEQQLITAPPARTDEVPPGALADLRERAMQVPIEQMQRGLAEFKERRDCFRKWLKEQLREGVHYGYPPKLQPKFNEDGDMLVWTKGRDGEKGHNEVVPKESWRAKPSLYKAGADFVCELMGAREEYKADMEAWQQMGAVKGTFVMCCRLFSRETGKFLGEGLGARKVGQKGGDENNSIKMAKKSAKVDAVLNVYGLSDLFTQDLEDMTADPPRHDNPAHDADAPSVPPRGERVTKEDVGYLGELYKKTRPKSQLNREAYWEWVESVIGPGKGKTESWTRDEYDRLVMAADIYNAEAANNAE